MREHFDEGGNMIGINLKDRKARALMQARVDVNLLNQVRKLIAERGWAWSDVIEACFEALLVQEADKSDTAAKHMIGRAKKGLR